MCYGLFLYFFIIIKILYIAPSPVTGFRVFYPVIVWEPPADSGMITNYEVTFSRGGQSNTLTSVLPYFVIQSGNVPGESGNFTMQVSMDVTIPACN